VQYGTLGGSGKKSEISLTLFSLYILYSDSFLLLCSSIMPAGIICPICEKSFVRARAFRRHQPNCRHPANPVPPAISPGLTPTRITVDIPESATHRDAAVQTTGQAGNNHLPLDAIEPARRISRARRQLIRPLLETSRPRVDVGVGTRLDVPHASAVYYTCPRRFQTCRQPQTTSWRTFRRRPCTPRL